MDRLHGARRWVRTLSVFINCKSGSVILDAHIVERNANLFKRLKWLPLKNETNIQKCTLIYRRIKDDNDYPSYIK